MKIYECDGCGRQERRERGSKPPEWFERTDSKTSIEYHACDRQCVEAISAKTGASRAILPV